jgi:uncharacterized protein YjeT (DUF2065 family)
MANKMPAAPVCGVSAAHDRGQPSQWAQCSGKEIVEMKLVVYFFGLAWIAAGTVAILYTDTYRTWLRKWVTGINRVWLSLAPAIVGLLLVLAASSTAHRGFVSLIGILAILKGIFIYFNPLKLFEASLNWFVGVSEQGIRLVGILILVLGTVVLSWIQ